PAPPRAGAGAGRAGPRGPHHGRRARGAGLRAGRPRPGAPLAPGPVPARPAPAGRQVGAGPEPDRAQPPGPHPGGGAQGGPGRYQPARGRAGAGAGGGAGRHPGPGRRPGPAGALTGPARDPRRPARPPMPDPWRGRETMQDRPKVIAFDVDPDSLACRRRAFPGWEVEATAGATPDSLEQDWRPGAADLLVVAARAGVAEALGLCRGLRSQPGRAHTPLLL